MKGANVISADEVRKFMPVFNLNSLEKEKEIMSARIFIGSSVEGVDVAGAIQTNLHYRFDVKVWSQGIFNYSSYTLVDLVRELDQCEFAIFVLSPDDITKMRNRDVVSARDNVLFEMGLFIGKLGMKQVFFVMPKIQDFHLPTDLLGFSSFRYDSSKKGRDLVSEVAPFTHHITFQIFDSTDGNLNLSGQWSERWRVEDSRSSLFEEYNEDTNATLLHVGDSVTAYFKSQQTQYRIKGTIRNNFITGIWEDVNNGPTYHGAFQLKINMAGQTMNGVWLGYDSQGNIKSNIWEWKRENVTHYPSEG